MLTIDAKGLAAIVGAGVLALVNGGIAIDQYFEKKSRLTQPEANEMAQAYQRMLLEKWLECEKVNGI